MIKKEGAHHLSLRQVAKNASCTPMATYRHFDSKDALLAEIAKEGFGRLGAEMEEAMKAFPNNPLDQLAAVGQRYIQMALKNPEHLLMMFGGFVSDKALLKTSGDSTFFALVDLMKRCQQHGLIPAVDPIKQAVCAWSVVHGFAMLIINGNMEFLGINLRNYQETSGFVTRAVIDGLKNFHPE